MISNQQPSITTGLRGLSYVEVELQVQTDLHSDCTEAVANQSMCWQNDCFASWWEQPHYHSGFYDNVEELSTEEMAKAPLALKYKALDLNDIYGEKAM
jgi:hypothetical protein